MDFRRLPSRSLEIPELEVPRPQPRLSADDGLHRALLAEARGPAGHEYLTENVIGNPHQTFGIEIEFARASRARVEAELSRQGLLGPGKWQMKNECHVSGEVVSPVLTDSPQTWADLQEICAVIRRYGGRASRYTGGNFHVGTQSSGVTTAEAREKLLRTYAWAEDLLYRLSGGSGPFRTHRGATTGYRFCAPLERSAYVTAMIGTYRGGKSKGLYIRNETIEFRYNDGTVDPERIQANIILACAMMQYAASERNDLPAEHNPVGLHRRLPDHHDRLLRAFADIVLQDPKQRLKIYSVYARTRWRAGVASHYIDSVVQQRRRARRSAPVGLGR